MAGNLGNVQVEEAFCNKAVSSSNEAVAYYVSSEQTPRGNPSSAARCGLQRAGARRRLPTSQRRSLPPEPRARTYYDYPAL